MIRLYFVGNSREYDSVIPLKFDHRIQTRIEKTYIIYGPFRTNFDLLGLYKYYGIDTSTFEVVPDLEITKKHKRIYNIDHLNMKSQGPFATLSMQLTKFLALDWVSNDKMMLQDCDVFLGKNYTPFDKGQTNLIVYEKNHPVDSTKILSGLSPRYNFISEFFPITKENWMFVKNYLNGDFYDVIINFLRFGKHEDIRNVFSEYELMGTILEHHNKVFTTLSKNTIINSIDGVLDNSFQNYHLFTSLRSKLEVDLMLNWLESQGQLNELQN